MFLWNKLGFAWVFAHPGQYGRIFSNNFVIFLVLVLGGFSFSSFILCERFLCVAAYLFLWWVLHIRELGLLSCCLVHCHFVVCLIISLHFCWFVLKQALDFNVTKPKGPQQKCTENNLDKDFRFFFSLVRMLLVLKLNQENWSVSSAETRREHETCE